MALASRILQPPVGARRFIFGLRPPFTTPALAGGARVVPEAKLSGSANAVPLLVLQKNDL